MDNNNFERELDKMYAADTPDPDRYNKFASTTLKASQKFIVDADNGLSHDKLMYKINTLHPRMA